MDNKTSFPFIVRADSYEEITNLIKHLKDKFGFSFDGRKGDFGCPWIYVNIENKTYMYGMSDVLITKPIVDKWIDVNDFLIILDIVYKNSHNEYEKKRSKTNHSDENTKKIVKKYDWRTQEMPEEYETIIFNRAFNEEELNILSYGHHPYVMEDKWFCYMEENKLYIHRSWTGFCIFIVEFNKTTSLHQVIVNTNKHQYKQCNYEENLHLLNDLINYWINLEFDWYKATAIRNKKTKKIYEFLEIKNKHDNEFLEKTGGDGNQQLRDEKHEKYEVPLLAQMSEDELREVMDHLTMFERQWIDDRFIKKYDAIESVNMSYNKTVLQIDDAFQVHTEKKEKNKFYCSLYEGILSEYEYDPLWNGEDLMKDREEIIRDIQTQKNEMKEMVKVIPEISSTYDLYLFNLIVVGTSYVKSYNEIVNELSDNDILNLIREPNNKYDKYAIKVITNNKDKIGYIPRNTNYVIAKLLDAGKKLYLKIISIQKGKQIEIKVGLYLEEPKMIYTELTKKALALSFNKHKDQVDKSGMPYVYHLFIVASYMKTESQVCVALLHDILEDTNTTEEDLFKEGFSNEIIDAIKTMTHKDNEDYFDYIKRVKSNSTSSVVKIADLKHNSDLTRLNNVTEEDLKRIEKYKKALDIIEKD